MDNPFRNILSDVEAAIAAEADAISQSPLLSIEQLPDLDLYLEQVTSYLEERLGDTLRSGEEKIITKPMVNNYTKAGLLPRPKNRRYGREHLIPLMFICYLKQSLSVQEIKTALDLQPTERDQRETYGHFTELVNDYRPAFSQMQAARVARIRAALGENATDEQLALLYVTLTSLEAAANKLLCSRILKRLQKNREDGGEDPV